MVRVNIYFRFILLSLLCFLVWRAVSVTTHAYLANFKNQRTDLFSVKRKDIINSSNHRKFQERTVRTRTRYPEAIRAGYILNNANACSSYKKVSCLILVYSKVTYWRVREILRHTWINATLYQPNNVVFMFLIGTSDDPKLQDIIKNESAKYQDIVQGDFVDSYRNLTNKGVMGLRWVTENCRNAEMVIKIDDDAFINIFKLLKDFSLLKERKKFIYCNKIEKDDMPIERNKRNKWYVQEDSFRGYSYYPHTYCSGIVVFLSIDIIPSLYRAAMATPFFWVDDFYLFGILPSKIPGVRYEDIGSNFTDRHRDIVRCLNEKKIQCQYVAMMTKFIRITKIWDAVLQNLL